MQDKMTMPETVSFHQMDEGTEDDYALLHKQEQNFITALPSRIVSALENLEHSLSGYQVSRLEHSLQTATRAEQGGADKELIVAALIHDIGDDLAPMNHSQYAASILRPYVSEKTYWIIKHHGLFQTYYSAHHLGGDRNARDKFKDHEHYQATINFCENYDQSSFDPNYKSMSLEDFSPMVKKIFSKTPYYYV